MHTALKARIIEVWNESSVDWIEVVAGANRYVLEIQQPKLLQGIHKGDLVELTITPSKYVNGITRLGGPSQRDMQSLADSMRWRRITGKPSRMSLIQQRQEILRAIREDLYQNGFLEVEVPLLIKGTCPDAVIESIPAGEGYLTTSTEYQIKRLMVGGFEKVFTLSKNFRGGDRGRYHSSEFTMLEWARAFGSLDEIEEDTKRFTQAAFRRLFPDQKVLNYQGNEIDLLSDSWERITVRQAFQKYLGIDGLSDFSLASLLNAAKQANIQIPPHFEVDQHLVLSYLIDLLQSHLGKNIPTFLREWPAYMTSSAQLNDHDPTVIERSELYIGGVEISNGFPFLTDATIQKDLFNRELQRRKDEGKPQVTLDLEYIQALEEGIPPGAGMALGMDRLVMVLTGASQISDVQAFSWDEL